MSNRVARLKKELEQHEGEAMVQVCADADKHRPNPCSLSTSICKSYSSVYDDKKETMLAGGVKLLMNK